MSIISIGNTTVITSSEGSGTPAPPTPTDLTIRIAKVTGNDWDVYIKSDTGSAEDIGGMQISFSNTGVTFVSVTEHLPYNSPGDWTTTFGGQTFLAAAFTGSTWAAPTTETKILTWTMNNSDSLGSINPPPAGSVIAKPNSVGGTYTVTYVLQP